MIYRAIYLLLLLTLVSGAVSSLHAQSAQWVRTNEGCSFLDHLRYPNATASSNVPCRDGKLNGEGVIKFFHDGHQYWEWQVQRARGATMVDGVMRSTVDEAMVQSKMKSCDFILRVEMTGPPTLGLEMPVVGQAIDSLAWVAVARECGQAVATAFKTQGGRFDVYYNGEYSDIRGLPESVESRRFSQYWQGREAAAIQAQAQAVERDKVNRIAAARAARRLPLSKRFGQYQITSLSSIAPNPFIWKGKLVGVCAMFDAMVSANTARIHGDGFTQALLTQVPTSRFPYPTVVFLVGRVDGQANGVLSLQFLGAVDQPRDDGCSDYIDR
jgi:hypothetical protein